MLVAGPLVELPYLPCAVMELIPKLDDVPIVEAEDEKRRSPRAESKESTSGSGGGGGGGRKRCTSKG
ncbi:hypothetical protein Tco_0479658, partial [Tanacetum coccineum]